MTRARTFAGLVAAVLLPVVATAQRANAKAAPRFRNSDRKFYEEMS
jgi:hypothetical protein